MFFGSVSARDCLTLQNWSKRMKAVVNISTIGKRQNTRSFGRPEGTKG